MTVAQREALGKVVALLGEHFDRSVVVIEWEINDREGGTGMQCYFQGGKWPAVGLLEGAKAMILDD